MIVRLRNYFDCKVKDKTLFFCNLQTSGDNVSVKSGDSNTSIDDTLALSAVSHTTSLPGTPDHVIDDDTEHQS